MFGSANYGKGELIAGMEAGYLNNQTRVLNENLLDNSVTYIQDWLAGLKNDTF